MTLLVLVDGDISTDDSMLSSVDGELSSLSSQIELARWLWMAYRMALDSASTHSCNTA